MLLTELTLADVGITAGGITPIAEAIQQYFQRLKVAQAKDQTMISGSEAISAQFATLEAAIKSNHLETGILINAPTAVSAENNATKIISFVLILIKTP